MPATFKKWAPSQVFFKNFAKTIVNLSYISKNLGKAFLKEPLIVAKWCHTNKQKLTS